MLNKELLMSNNSELPVVLGIFLKGGAMFELLEVSDQDLAYDSNALSPDAEGNIGMGTIQHVPPNTVWVYNYSYENNYYYMIIDFPRVGTEPFYLLIKNDQTGCLPILNVGNSTNVTFKRYENMQISTTPVWLYKNIPFVTDPTYSVYIEDFEC